MKLISYILICAGLLVPIQSVTAEEPIVAVCCEYPPYWYMEGGVIKGDSVALVKAVLEEAKLPYKLEIRPWKRTYEDGLRVKNIMVTCIGRTEKRENLFRWIGPTTEDFWISFIGLKNKGYKVEKLRDFGKYTIGVERGSYTQQFLEARPSIFKKESIKDVTHQQQIIKLLKMGRVDFVLFQEISFNDLLRKSKEKTDDYQYYFRAFSTAEYLSISKATDIKLVEKIKSSYSRLKTTGQIKLRK